MCSDQKFFDKLSLTKYVTFYSSGPTKMQKRENPHTIHYVRYNLHIDHESYCGEKHMLYALFRASEHTLLLAHETWIVAFNANKAQIINIKEMFTAQSDHKCGDIRKPTILINNDIYLAIDLENKIDQNKQPNKIKKYDIITDLKHARNLKFVDFMYNSLFLEISHPFFLSNN